MERLQSVKSVRIWLSPEGRPVVAVAGEASTAGWSDLQIWPWHYINNPKDGILDLDLVGKKPTDIVKQVVTAVTVPTIEFPFAADSAWGAGRPLTGVRVHAVTGVVEAMLGESPMLAEDRWVPWPWRTAGGDLVPWPW